MKISRICNNVVLFLLSETGLEEAATVTERIRTSIEGNSLKYKTESIKVTVSIGTGELKPNMASIEDFIETVDHALYKAKDSGRKRVQVAE